MMPPMPRIHAEHLLQCKHPSVLGMSESATEVGRIHRSKHGDPPQVQRIEELERNFKRYPPRISQLGPRRFVIWFYSGLVFGQRQLEAAVCVEMAVGHVVDRKSVV